MRSRPKALQESEGSVPRAAERARCGELHIRAGRARRFRASARLEASPSSHKVVSSFPWLSILAGSRGRGWKERLGKAEINIFKLHISYV